MIPEGKRRYLDFDPRSGYPAGRDVFFDCVRCGTVLPSMPLDSMACKCGNVRIDVDYGRIGVTDHELLKAFFVVEP
jgi:hypothetical protein